MLPNYTPKAVLGAAALLLAVAAWWQFNDPARRAAEAGNQRLIHAVAQHTDAYLLRARQEAEAKPDAWEPNFRLASGLYRRRVNQIRLQTKGEEVSRPVGTMPGDRQVQRVMERLMQLATTPTQRELSEGLLKQFYGSAP